MNIWNNNKKIFILIYLTKIPEVGLNIRFYFTTIIQKNDNNNIGFYINNIIQTYIKITLNFNLDFYI